jgi:hypothetical protein
MTAIPENPFRLFCDNRRRCLQFGDCMLKAASEDSWYSPFYARFSALSTRIDEPAPGRPDRIEQLFSFLDAREINMPLPLLQAIYVFSRNRKSVGAHSLIAFVDTLDSSSLDDDKRVCWDVMSSLKYFDEPGDHWKPDDSMEPLTVGGMPLIAKAYSPFYRTRRSRYAPGCLTLVFQHGDPTCLGIAEQPAEAMQLWPPDRE